MLEKAKEYREKLIEAAVELDDERWKAYLEGKSPTRRRSSALIRKARSPARSIPVLCGSAFKNKGVQPLLDAVSTICRRRSTCPPIKGIDEDGDNEVVRKPNDKEPFSALAFKIMTTRSSALTFCRIYSGTCSSGHRRLNSTKDKKERIGRMLLMHANNREDIKEAYAGDIVALAGLKDVHAPATRCAIPTSRSSSSDGIPGAGHRDRDRAEDQGRPGKDGRRAGEAARKIRRSACRPTRSPARPSSRAWASCISTSRSTSLKRDLKVEANIGAPQVAYRETITKRVESSTPTRSRPAVPASSPKSRSSSSRTSPARASSSRTKIVGGAVPKEYIPGVEKGLKSDGLRRARRLPGGRRQGHADRRQVSRRRLVGAGLRNRRARGVPRSAAEGQVRFCSSRS
jgi:elongation factor G